MGYEADIMHFIFQSLLLIVEGILVLSGNNVLAYFGLNHQRLVKLHWILQVCAAVSLVIGFGSIIAYKRMYDQAHFETWHAITGLISAILFVISCVGGVVALYSTVFQHWVKPAHVKLAHFIVGILAFVIGIISEAFGIYTRWFLYYTNETVQLVCVLLIILVTVLSIQDSMTNIYHRIKRLLS